jgi:hypothetical protein
MMYEVINRYQKIRYNRIRQVETREKRGERDEMREEEE